MLRQKLNFLGEKSYDKSKAGYTPTVGEVTNAMVEISVA